MKVQIKKNSDEVDAYVSMLMVSRILGKSEIVMALATGNTTKSLYKYFNELVTTGQIDTDKFYGLAVDEYAGIPDEDRIGCRFRLVSMFIDNGIIKPGNLFAPNDFQGNSFQEICNFYDEKINSLGGIDLQILGIGNNGHLGFNEPGTSFSTDSHVVNLMDTTREILAKKYNKDNLDQIPPKGITMGLKTIMHSKEIVLVIKGAQKASIAAKTVSGPITESVPASILQLHPNCLVVLDQDAAVELKKLQM